MCKRAVVVSDVKSASFHRALYDDDEQEEFLLSLQSRVKLHEKDIERMCNKNYQGFIESVTELVKVKSEAHKLRNKVENANRTIQDSGREVRYNRILWLVTECAVNIILSCSSKHRNFILPEQFRRT